ncbi:hypothetical protein TREMEDRAFT_70570 [Tremella mesenterica DSM 1558]|uniref:uncharacterized protein n=1 Tax=Tremella mesenterica (strain ATCC 24925 / CBS 8224 / DSM 1558 / NBRC 9311 / NRRL Y-6157 / RJB 2259-6 / UBC 559-6) TaxID=578456 RepID=UPI00032CF984|nr:uncharacterized protein TREMEDRAFT_70570 [Tremella mesenterica DSM 1558]EIW65440.1 hypothetical protein TREMEDRAFT_70570 [Tremella mesenterica DSM 1558]
MSPKKRGSTKGPESIKSYNLRVSTSLVDPSNMFTSAWDMRSTKVSREEVRR